MGSLITNLRVALRSFLGRPGLALPAVLILGVGIGAATTIFSVFDRVLLRGLPYPDGDRLVQILRGSHTPPDFIEWRDGIDAFEAIGAVWPKGVELTGEDTPATLRAALVTPEFLPILGARAGHGRLFTRDEYVGQSTAVLLDYGTWQRRWGGDPAIVGKSISLGRRSHVVVGIVDRELELPRTLTGTEVDVWLPLDVAQPGMESRGFKILGIVGRLKEDTHIVTAQGELDAVTRSMAERFPERYKQRDGSVVRFPLISVRLASIRGTGPALFLLQFAVGLLLLIGCANVANLLLAHGTQRAREMVLRRALGASPWHVFGQLFTESILLAAVGGVVGVWIAHFTIDVVARVGPESIPLLKEASVNGTVLGFAVMASLITGVLCGIPPALQAVRGNVSRVLKEGSSGLTPGRRGRRQRNFLVVIEIALALVLLTGAGLLFRTLIDLMHVDPGFKTEALVTLPLFLGEGYDDVRRNQFAEDLIDRVGALPRTRAVGAGITVPFQFYGAARCCWTNGVTGMPAADDSIPVEAWMHPITPGYFEALSAPLIYGRAFTREDSAGGGRVTILNERTALQLFGTANAVGRTVRKLPDQDLTVIGIVGGVYHWGMSHGVDYAVYLPHRPWAGFVDRLHLVVRTDADPRALAPALREIVAALDPNLPVDEIVTMQQRVDRSMTQPRFLSLLFGSFAAIALVLASGGIYASMLHLVGLRRRELGIRFALGADRSRVIGLVLGYGMRLTASGLGLGIVGALLFSLVLNKMVWGVPSLHLPTIAAVVALLALISLAACWVPAFRASRVHPMETLRDE